MPKPCPSTRQRRPIRSSSSLTPNTSPFLRPTLSPAASTRQPFPGSSCTCAISAALGDRRRCFSGCAAGRGAMTRIVTAHYRYKRPPRKRKPVALDMPAVVVAKSSRRTPPIGGKGGAAAEDRGRSPPAITTGRRAQSSTSRDAARVISPSNHSASPANGGRKPPPLICHQQEAVEAAPCGQAGDGARQRPRSRGAGEGVPCAHGASGRQ